MMRLHIYLGWATLLSSQAVGAPLEDRQTKSDPCQALQGATAWHPSQVQACLKSIPFNNAARTNLMGMATSLYSLDVFQYNQLYNSNPSLDQGVDIQSQFSRINSTTYSSDYDFQDDLSTVMNSLNDGHHYWQNCYRTAFSTRHPLAIVSVLPPDNSSSTPNVYLAPDLPLYLEATGLTKIYASYGINATQLAGAQVNQINGQDVFSYLTNTEINRVGQYQDPQQRLNYLFASSQVYSGQYGRNAGAFATTYDLRKDNFTMGVKSLNGTSSTITVPWITIWQGTSNFTYSSGQEFYNQVCLLNGTKTGSPSTASNSSQSTSGSSNSSAPSLAVFAQQAYINCPVSTTLPTYPLSKAYSPALSQYYLGGRDVQFYLLPNTTRKTGVVVVSTFEPLPMDNQNCTNRFLVDLIYGLQNLSKAGVEDVLIDTSNNGGGSVQLNQAMQRLFTGQQYLDESNFQTVLRKSPLSQALLASELKSKSNQSTIYDSSVYRNGTTELSAGLDFFNPGLSRSINSNTLYTSTYLEDSIEEIQMVSVAFNVSQQAPYPPKNIVFTGNGLCGSACSSFTNFLIEYYNGTGSVWSAQPSKQIEFQAFAAGQATTSTAIYKEAQAVGLNSTALLPQQQIAGTFGFALRAAISPNIAPGTFIQYRPFPAKQAFGLTIDQYLSPIVFWTSVANRVFQ